MKICTLLDVIDTNKYAKYLVLVMFSSRVISIFLFPCSLFKPPWRHIPDVRCGNFYIFELGTS